MLRIVGALAIAVAISIVVFFISPIIDSLFHTQIYIWFQSASSGEKLGAFLVIFLLIGIPFQLIWPYKGEKTKFKY